MAKGETNVTGHQEHSRSQVSNFQAHATECDPLAGAAHDLCNHLQVVSSALSMIKQAVGIDAPATLELMFDGARTSLERATCLGRTIIHNGRLDPARVERVSIIDRLASLQPLVLSALGPAITVEMSVSDGMPDVFCNANALDDAILNILMNAGRAMPDGGHVLITAARESLTFDGPPCVVMRIADTGCGMTSQTAARAFEPGFTTRELGLGSGLGLSMVADFASKAGGSAELQSLPGIGTVVTMRLPGMLKCARAAGMQA